MSKILIIDDEAAVRGILKFQLEKAGHEVLEGADGDEALRLARTSKPDLLFLDGVLPKKDGWRVCRDLKSDPATKAMPIVLLTSSTQNVDELRGWESGADEYLTKPWDPAQLHDTVKRFLGSAPKPA